MCQIICQKIWIACCCCSPFSVQEAISMVISRKKEEERKKAKKTKKKKHLFQHCWCSSAVLVVGYFMHYEWPDLWLPFSIAKQDSVIIDSLAAIRDSIAITGTHIPHCPHCLHIFPHIASALCRAPQLTESK